MTKDVLTISMSNVDVERLFFIVRDVITYRKNRFHEATIENIMLLKKNCYHMNTFAETDEEFINETKQAMNDELLDEMINLETE
jgi:hypothetical protein